MLEIAGEVLAYLQESALLSLGIAFLAGIAADKSVSSDRRSGFIFFVIIGVIGLFLGEFALLFFGLKDYLESVSEFRILFDFIAAYVGSFFVAAIIHFIKPT